MGLEMHQGLHGALLGRGLGRAVHGRRADLAAPGGAGRPGLGQLGPRRHRAHDRVRRDLAQVEPGTVLLRARVSLPPRGGHGVCRRPRGLPSGHRGQARARAGELPPGGEARRGRDGGGLASPASHAGTARRDQADPALAGRGWPCRSVGGGRPPVRARGPGHRPPPLAPHGGAVRLRDGRRRRVLLRHGAARRPRCRLAAPPLRADPARAGHLPAAPGLPLALRGAVVRPGASRHQAREHLPLPLRRGVRLREGAGFRNRGSSPRRGRARMRCTRGRTRSRARRRSSPRSRRWEPSWTGAPTSTRPAAWPTGS